MKIPSKIGMSGLAVLSGIAMMGAGSFALFTAHSQSKTQNFGAGVVDITLQGKSNVYSNVKQIAYYNMVPGDHAGGYIILHNSGSVAEILNLKNNVHGPIFWNDGLNNGKVVTLTGFVKGASRSANAKALFTDSPYHSTVYQTYANYWQPRLLTGGPKLIPGVGYESVDYSETGGVPAYQTDDHPAYYTLQYAVYDNKPTVTANPQDYPRTLGYIVTGTPVETPQNATLNYDYWQSGYSKSGTAYAKAVGTLSAETSDTGFTRSLTSQLKFSGTTQLKGVVLQPGQYLLVTYRGGLPRKAHNDYQDSWGGVQVEVNAAQYENNHGDIQNPDSHGAQTTLSQPSAGNAGSDSISPVPVAPKVTYTASLKQAPPSSNPVYAGQQMTYVLQLQNASGQPVSVPASDIELSVSKGTPAAVVFGPLHSLGNGMYSFTVTDSRAEMLQVKATVNVQGQSVSVESGTVALAVDSIINGSLTEQQSTEQAGQSDVYTLTLKNGLGQPLEGIASDISMSLEKGTAADIAYGPIIETTPGVYTVSVTDTKAETLQLVANVATDVAHGSFTGPDEQIKPGPASKLVVSPSYDQIPTYGSQVKVTVRLEDRYGNIVPANDPLWGFGNYENGQGWVGIGGGTRLYNGEATFYAAFSGSGNSQDFPLAPGITRIEDTNKGLYGTIEVTVAPPSNFSGGFGTGGLF
ncbi:CalY family protein [Alicyclobacillus sp. SP_1]|uniref:CalY family protein n=1 Tax=Alicyclobacillus sp. SP_1 TaxID=2942475 RepID=UPI0021589E8D|nr:CalY family protein [Alicyclobacillus sp. SP_1]